MSVRLVVGAAVCVAVCLIGAFFLSIDPPLTDAVVDVASIDDFDIVLMAGRSIRGRVIRLFGGVANEWSHVGVLRLEGDQVFVLHATPDAIDRNAIQYEPLETLFRRRALSAVRVIRLTGLTPEQREAVRGNFERIRSEVRPFDYALGSRENDAIYCSELVLVVFSEIMCDVERYSVVHPGIFGTIANSVTVLEK